MNKILLHSLLPALLLTGCVTKQVTAPDVLARPPESRPIQEQKTEALTPASRPPAQTQSNAPDTPVDVAGLLDGPANEPSAAVARGGAPGAMRLRAQEYYATPAPPPAWQPPASASGEGYTRYADNTVQITAQNPVSTFGLDVDTGSYSNVRRFLNQGQLPPRDAVRVEELLNYFTYDFPAPDRGTPFAVRTELGAAPWNQQHLLLRVGVKAVSQSTAAMPPANLVFLVDVSGSMDEADKLPLVRNGLKLLASQLRPQDHVSLVVYAGDTEVLLPSTGGDDKAAIYAAIDRLQAGGSTNGQAGIDLAYQQARRGFVQGGINRILLATDGDFNVGVTDIEQLKALIARSRKTGISLTTLGVGQGNYQEPVMQQLADVGDGNYAYLDSLDEARKVLLEQLSSTLNTVAADVKLQMEFNPRVVKEWRLIGYEKRALREEDFRNDRVDAGEVGAGKSVVALYELTPVATHHERRYSDNKAGGESGELAYLKIRYKTPDHSRVAEMQRVIQTSGYGAPGPDWRFAAAVAGFGELLRGGDTMGNWGWQDVKTLAQQGVGHDVGGYRQDFVRLVDLAAAIAPAAPQVSEVTPPSGWGRE